MSTALHTLGKKLSTAASKPPSEPHDETSIYTFPRKQDYWQSWWSILVCRAVITKYHRLSGWNDKQTLTSQGSGGWESKARMLADSGPGGSPPPGLQASLCVPTQQRQREHPLWSLPLGRTLIPSWVPTPLTSSNPNYLQMPSPYGLPQEHSRKEPTCQCRRHGWRRSSGGGNGNPLQYSCLGKFCGQTSPAGYSPWVADGQTRLRTHTHTPHHIGV